MEEILKLILDYGLTGAALVVLCYVILQQMKLLTKMEERMSKIEELERANSQQLVMLHTKLDAIKL